MICKVFLAHAALLLLWTSGFNFAGIFVIFALSALVWFFLKRLKKPIKHKPVVIFRG
jgi:hypothetical protein